jgi:membrane protease YdiL (CAAX protease family)
MTQVVEGRTGLLHLLRRYLIWRVDVQWYLFALLGISAMILLSFLVLPGSLATLHTPTSLFALTYLATYLVIFIIGGPLFEEPGWRGFALPRLQQRWGPLMGSLLLGVFWGLWHLPLFLFVPGYDGAGSGFVNSGLSFLEFVIYAMALTYIITWVFNNTRGSLLLPMLIHASINTAVSFIHPTPLVILSRYLCFVVLALLIIAATRGGLGYRRDLREAALPTPQVHREQEPAAAHTSL